MSQSHVSVTHVTYGREEPQAVANASVKVIVRALGLYGSSVPLAGTGAVGANADATHVGTPGGGRRC